PETYTLSLHDALPISRQDPVRHRGQERISRAEQHPVVPTPDGEDRRAARVERSGGAARSRRGEAGPAGTLRHAKRAEPAGRSEGDRKSTRLNSSHVSI